MSIVQVIDNPREPEVCELLATGHFDASVAVLGDTVQSTWWIGWEDARRLHNQLGRRLAQRDAVKDQDQ